MALEEYMKVPAKQVEMAFVATCIEAMARITGTSYKEAFQRMQNTGAIEDFIAPNYETLHTESRENVVKNILDYIRRKENG